jgi:hypothetical protein
MSAGDETRLRWIRFQPCCAPGPHLGAVEAHHETTDRRLGQKADDSRSMPLCRRCHRSFHDATGSFRDWTKAQRRAWQAEQVAEHQQLYERSKAIDYDVMAPHKERKTIDDYDRLKAQKQESKCASVRAAL